MANEIVTAFNATYPDGPSSAPTPPGKAAIRSLGVVIQSAIDEKASAEDISNFQDEIAAFDDRVEAAEQAVADIVGATVGPLLTEVSAGQTTTLPASTYSNGTAGVGATITGNANGALADSYFDDVTIEVGRRLWVRMEGAANGVYVVTAVGDGSNPFILTRAADADSPVELGHCRFTVRSGGDTYGAQGYQCQQAADDITVGTTTLTFAMLGDLSGIDLDTKEEKVSGITPTTDAPRFVIRNKAGNDASYYKPDGSLVVPALEVQSTRTVSIDDAYLVVQDAFGNRIFEISLEAVTRMVTARVADSLLASAAEGWMFTIGDAEGNIVFGVADDGTVYGAGLDGSSAGGGTTHTVAYAFAEPYTDPSKDLLVTWVSTSDAATVLEYRIHGATLWQAASSRRSRAFPNLTGQYLHTALLEGLAPNTRYDLRWPGATKTDAVITARIAGVNVCVASDYQRTAEADYNETSRLSQFGDAFAARDCDLLVWNGDIVADDGQFGSTQATRWHWMLTALTRDWRRDGCLTPMIMIMGNHEAAQPDGSPNNMSGGNGLPGMIVDILSNGYDTELPTYAGRSQIAVTIGKEVGFVTIETDHTLPIAPQIAQLEARLAAQAASVRHLNVVGHSPAYHARVISYERNPTQARLIKELVWPAMETHASKVRAYWCGHEHQLAATARLRHDWDGGETDLDNDRRWITDAENGVRQLGSGMTGGGTPGKLVDGVYDETSIIDSSPKFIAALGYDGAGTLELSVLGDVDTDGVSTSHNMWIASYSADGFTARAVTQSNHLLFTIEE